MLNLLFGSEARVKILNLFLLHPESKYYVNQIANELKLAPSIVRKEIDNIYQLGLIIEAPIQILEEINNIPEEVKQINSKSKNKKNLKKIKEIKKEEKKYFEINRGFVLYQEIKALFIKAQILSSQKFISLLEKNFQPKLLILTGFFTNYPEAQTDLLIVGPVKRPSFLKLIAELEKD